MKLLNKIKCLLFGHIKSNKDTVLTSIYIEEPYGAFYQGQRFIYDGRLYRCQRGRALIHIHGVLDWELVDLIKTTLKDLPEHLFDIDESSYEFCRIYE